MVAVQLTIGGCIGCSATILSNIIWVFGMGKFFKSCLYFNIMKLFLIRHGESIKKGDDVVLSEKGLLEAKALAEKLQKIPIDKIYASDYTRALETMRPYLDKKPKISAIKTSDLREVYRVIVGGPERQGTSNDRKENDIKRAIKIWNILIKEKGNIAIFAHGNIIRFFLMMALNIKSGNFWDKILISSGSISIIEINNELIRVNAINLIDHLPSAKQFYSKNEVDTVYHS